MQVGTAQVGTAQVGIVQVGTVQVGTAQVGTAQVGTAQVGTAQVGTAQVGIAQVGTVQVGTAQVGVAQAVESVFFEDGFDVFAFEDAVWRGDLHWWFPFACLGCEPFSWGRGKGFGMEARDYAVFPISPTALIWLTSPGWKPKAL